MINERIKSDRVLVIDQNDEQVGILSLTEAISRARQLGLDLVQVSTKSDPPVTKIVDWGKLKYKQTKQQQKNKKQQKQSEVKQMRFGLKISDNDMRVKLKKVDAFMQDGHKVKISVMFRGREMAHKELGNDLIKKMTDILGDDIIVEQKPTLAGRNLNVVLRRK